MVALAVIPLEIGAEWLLAALGVAAVGTTAVVVLDKSKTDDKTDAPAIPDIATRTRSRNCKCPPDKGIKIRRNHGVNWNSYRYQARITGFAFDQVGCAWSEEWSWLGRDFDGYQQGECLLQEAKGNYDQFLDRNDRPLSFFEGFEKMTEQVEEQATRVHANPPAKLMWYFQTPRAMEYMIPVLAANAVPFVCVP
ncbi:restriction endonuclease fold toxin 5 domain-containing protein [Paraburkholderia sp. J94]|uniref:restriction endonuclease fold toxin 5 domain-containing protein n=1 Tax=Paraburkholderia sp. J94 TaxID=2805441 RepID=UPI002AB1DEAA|nr:restriction endonuclease fold toxin 5 domain-containing protein [Paraburkholderia sp. J94]